jgi:hypothetical protein
MNDRLEVAIAKRRANLTFTKLTEARVEMDVLSKYEEYPEGTKERVDYAFSYVAWMVAYDANQKAEKELQNVLVDEYGEFVESARK